MSTFICLLSLLVAVSSSGITTYFYPTGSYTGCKTGAQRQQWHYSGILLDCVCVTPSHQWARWECLPAATTPAVEATSEATEKETSSGATEQTSSDSTADVTETETSVATEEVSSDSTVDSETTQETSSDSTMDVTETSESIVGVTHFFY